MGHESNRYQHPESRSLFVSPIPMTNTTFEVSLPSKKVGKPIVFKTNKIRKVPEPLVLSEEEEEDESDDQVNSSKQSKPNVYVPYTCSPSKAEKIKPSE